MAKKNWLIITIVIFGLVLSCAFDVIRVKQEPAQFEPNASEQDAWTLGQNINVSLDTG